MELEGELEELELGWAFETRIRCGGVVIVSAARIC